MRQFITTILFCCIFISTYAQAPAPDFTVTTSKGQEISLYADYLDKGTTVVLELFWEGCPPCNTFAPFLGDVYKDWGNGMDSVEFIAMDVMASETNENISLFQERHGHTWPGVSAEGGSLEALAGFIDGTYGRYIKTPTMIVIAPDGTVAFDVTGFDFGLEGSALLSEAIAQSRIPKPALATVSGTVSNAEQTPIANVTLRFEGSSSEVLSPTEVTVDAAGQFSLADLPINQSYTVTPSKMGEIGNGITTFDLVLMSKHILGVTPFTDTTQIIAADVNLSGGVTTFDIVQARRVLLGFADTFKAGSWRFLPSQIELASLNDLSDLSFVGIKIGDINNSADFSLFTAAEPRSAKPAIPIIVPDKKIQAGELVTIPFTTSANVLTGFQYTLNFEETVLELLDVSSTTLPNFGSENVNTRNKDQGQIAMSWFHTANTNPKELFTLQFRAKQDGQLRELLSFSNAITKVEAYTRTEEVVDLTLAFTPIAKGVNDLEISLFPNPLESDLLKISLNLPQAQNIQIDLLSIEGKAIQQVIRQSVAAGKHTLDVPIASSLKAGIYLLKIREEAGKIVYKRLVKK